MSSNADPITALTEEGFEVLYKSHAKSILTGEFASSLVELADALANIKLPITEIIGSGGGETKFTQRLRRTLANKGWKKHNFQVSKIVDNAATESTSHEVDHVKRVDGIGVIGCEIEWNNKDPFFDRDLENFKRLHAEGAISVGIIITRGSTLQDQLHPLVRQFADERGITDLESLAAAGVEPTTKQKRNILARVQRLRNPIPFAEAWTDNFVSNKFGQATTHWNKLIDRLDRGVGNPCPLLLIGLPAAMVYFDNATVDPLEENLEDVPMTDTEEL